MLYIITISRLVLGLCFVYSFATKLHDIAAFESAIRDFQLLPSCLCRPAVLAFIVGEALIVLTALLGEHWLFLSYILAILLLALFIFALNSVLKRKIQITCSCFGISEKKISPYDVWRNMGIILVALLGLISLLLDRDCVTPSLSDLLLSGIVAAILSLLLLNLREILELVP